MQAWSAAWRCCGRRAWRCCGCCHPRDRNENSTCISVDYDDIGVGISLAMPSGDAAPGVSRRRQTGCRIRRRLARGSGSRHALDVAAKARDCRRRIGTVRARDHQPPTAVAARTGGWMSRGRRGRARPHACTPAGRCSLAVCGWGVLHACRAVLRLPLVARGGGRLPQRTDSTCPLAAGLGSRRGVRPSDAGKI